MARAASARRYAEAAFAIARQQGELERWLSDLQDIAQALKEPLWMEVMDSFKVSFETKRRMISEVFDEANPVALNLVYLLISKGRLRLLPRVIEEYDRLLDDYKGVEHARVITAVALEEANRRKLEEVLKSISGKEVDIATELDPSIIGGIVVHLGDKIIDGSVRSRLEALRKRLAEAAT